MTLKRYKNRLCYILVLLCLMTTAVFAAGNIDLNNDVTLKVSAVFGKKPVSGMQFDAYLISNVDDCGELTVLDRYEAYAGELDIRGKQDEAWQEMASKLEREILLSEDVKPTRTALTDQDGIAAFMDIPMGLYLVIGNGVERDGYVYTTAPFFVMLPEQDLTSNTWNYQVFANAKPEQNPVVQDYKVLKIWKDECHKSQRPKSIQIQLVCDGEPYGDPVTLPENGRWEHTWENLDVNHKWTVTEAAPEGYKTPEVEQNGNQFIVTNTCSKTTTSNNPNLPQTGQLWWPVPVLLCAGLFLVVVGLIRRRGSEREN